jgi:IS5 family transposase
MPIGVVKGGRDTQYGHKVFLTVGRSGLILDCLVPRGNPADTTLYPSMLARQVELYQRPPRQVAADGSFASRENLAAAQRLGVKDAMFAKKRGLRILDMVKSLWVYQKLWNFRAGIEAAISRAQTPLWPGPLHLDGLAGLPAVCLEHGVCV